MTTNAEHLYDSINSAADVEGLVNSATPEGLYLEFKQKDDPSTGVLSEPDKKNFAKALSSFANSDGGVLLWGVQTQPTSGQDVANASRPISELSAFVARLEKYLKDATQPYVDDVLLRPIFGADDVGYVKCLIPASEKMPHRAMKDREYYRRSGGNSHKVEHFELEDMFGKRSRPFLTMNVEVRDGRVFWFYIENVGRAIAKHVGLAASSEDISIGRLTEPFFNVSQQDGPATFLMQEDTLVLHPVPIVCRRGGVLFERRRDGRIRLKVTWYCENMRYRQEVFTFE